MIAWNRRTDEVKSGQLPAGAGFTYWLLKFDGVAGNKDRELEDPQGYGAIEYGYALMARAAGITMAFLMDQAGQWSLAPAFDVTYSFQPVRRLDRHAPDDHPWQA